MNLGPLVAWLRRKHHLAIERERLRRISAMSAEEYAAEQLLSARELRMLKEIADDPKSSDAARTDARSKIAAHAEAIRLNAKR